MVGAFSCYRCESSSLLTVSSDSIFRALSLIPFHDVSSHQSPPPPSREVPSPYRISFCIYKPNTPFRKSNPPPPDFRLCVLSTLTDPFIPTLSDLTNLFARYTTPAPPSGRNMDRMMNLRLKHGWRNMVIAVVDNGVVSFLRIADSGFGREKLFGARTGAGAGQGKGGGGQKRQAKK